MKYRLPIILILAGLLFTLSNCDEYSVTINVKNSLDEGLTKVSIIEIDKGVGAYYYNVPPYPNAGYLTTSAEMYGEQYIIVAGITSSGLAIQDNLGTGYKIPQSGSFTIEIAAVEGQDNPVAQIIEYEEEKINQRPCIIIGERLESDGGLSVLMQQRLDDALTLYQSGYIEYFICCGGVIAGSVTEASVMEDYLLANGIDSSIIFKDETSTDIVQKIQNGTDIVQSLGDYYKAFILASESDLTINGMCATNFAVREGRAYLTAIEIEDMTVNLFDGSTANQIIYVLDYVLFPYIQEYSTVQYEDELDTLEDYYMCTGLDI